MATSAIYYQKSAVVQDEFKLIEVATLREMEVEKLQKVVREVKELRRECDEVAILETVTLFNKVRDATVELIRSISVWQESFTTPIRPRILDCDYIIDRMIYHIDFINSTKLKRVFNFQFYRGNVLLLPYPNPKSAEPVRVNSALGVELKKFAAPSEETVVFCYQFLINCLPDDVYRDKVAPLRRWLIAGWVPRVWVMDPKPVPVRRNSTATTAKSKGTSSTPTGSRRSSLAYIDTTPVTPTGSRRPSLARIDPIGKPASPTNGAASDTDRVALTPKGRAVRRPSISGNTSKPGTPTGAEAGGPKTKMKRRNQMLGEEAAHLQTITLDTNTADADLQAQQLDEYAQSLRRKAEQELSGLDTYFQEMELLFMPALGRRAVQTMLVGGTRVNADTNFNESELFHQPEKIVFHHTVRAGEEGVAEPIQNIPQAPENAKRANADTITKRNRLMKDRGDQPDTAPKYASFRASGSFRPRHLAKRNTNPMKLSRALSGVSLLDEPSEGPSEIIESEADKIIRIRESLLSPGATLKKNYYPISAAKTLDDSSVKAASVSARQRTASFLSTGRRMSDATMDTTLPLLNAAAAAVAAAAAMGTPTGVAYKDRTLEAFPRPEALILTPPPSAIQPVAGVDANALGEVTPGGETAGGTANEEADNAPLTSRSMRRRDSRRMSDLTVTFSVADGLGALGDSNDGVFDDITVHPTQPFIGQSSSTRVHKSSSARNTGMSPQRIHASGSSPSRKFVSPSHRSSKSPEHRSSRSPSSTKDKAAVGGSGKFFTASPASVGSRRSSVSRSVASDTNEYGIKIKPGSPPRASESLKLSTDSMRAWFANHEDVALK